MELIYTTVIFFVFGSILGSFLCVLVDRLPRGQQVVSGRSKCEHCGKVLKPFELVPIFSYLALKGKCSHCHKKIPPHVFFVEFLGGILTAAFYVYAISSGIVFGQILVVLIVMFSLAGIFLTDIYSGIIPDEFIVAIVILSLLLIILFNPSSLVTNLITAFVSFGLFLFLFLVTHGRGMGFGDVKLSFAFGLFLGFPGTFIGLYVAFLTGAAISLILVLTGRKKLRGDTIPFGPFLVTGIVVAYFFGEKLLRVFIG